MTVKKVIVRDMLVVRSEKSKSIDIQSKPIDKPMILLHQTIDNSQILLFCGYVPYLLLGLKFCL